jgi:F0F1-type ATP synthase membrane subunit b/b'
VEETEEQRHYETLVKVFKYLITMGVTVGAVLVGVAYFFIGNNLNDVNRRTAEGLQKFEEQTQAMKVESDQAIKDRREEADRQMDNFRKNMETFLNLTRDVTQMEMTTASAAAKELAISSAKERIEEAFKANNVQLLVDTAARKVVGDRVDLMVEQELIKHEPTIDSIVEQCLVNNEVISVIPHLISLIDRIRAGDRTAVDTLDSLANFSGEANLRNEAHYLLMQKGKDYDSDVDSLLAHQMRPPISLKQFGVSDTQLVTHADTMRVMSAIENVILTSPDLYEVSNAFVALRRLTKMDIESFDITAVKRLRKQSQ